MAGKLIICFITAFALIQPFNTLPAASPEASPAADHRQEVIYRNSKGEYYNSDGVILTDQYPIYWRHKNSVDPKKEHVVIVEPTITYSRQAEYSTTQAAPSSSSSSSTTTFRASAKEGQSDFRPYDGRTESGSGSAAVAYYPYYIRASSSDRNDIEERRRFEEGKRIVIDASDPAYQRFVPRDGAGRDDRGDRGDRGGQTWYYYSERPSTSSSTSSPPQPPKPTLNSRSSVRFYFPNGTEISTYYNEADRQVMDIHPNRYVIQVTELTTTTTPRPDFTTTDCPPFHPCNAVVYQQTTQCCKCYLVPNRCCPCTYPANRKK